jgi:hypothetical protein
MWENANNFQVWFPHVRGRLVTREVHLLDLDVVPTRTGKVGLASIITQDFSGGSYTYEEGWEC